MANRVVQELQAKSDAAWAGLSRQLDGIEPYLERADAPGEWTAREVLSHLLLGEGLDFVATLRTFTRQDLPVIEIDPGATEMTPARERMTLRELADALDAQRRSVLGYLEELPEADLSERKARIPLFKQFLGTDEVPIATFVGAMLDFHWNDHAGQLAKIRRAVGLPAR